MRLICRPYRLTAFALPMAMMLMMFAAPDAFGQAEPPARPTANLEPIWEDGQTSRYQSVTRRQVDQVRTIMGKTNKSRQLMVFDAKVKWEVLDAAEDGGGEVEMKIESLEMKMTGPDGKTYSASAKNADEPLASAQSLMKGLTSRPVKMRVAADGTIERVRGWEALADAAGDAGDSLTEQDFRELAVELALLPGGKAEATRGTTWEQAFNWSHEMGELKLDTEYKVVALERVAGVPLANVQAKSEVDFEIDREKFGQLGQGGQGPKVDLKFRGGKQVGQIMFDLSRHEIVGHNINRQLKFQMDLDYKGRSFRQEMTHSMNTQVIRLDEK